MPNKKSQNQNKDKEFDRNSNPNQDQIQNPKQDQIRNKKADQRAPHQYNIQKKADFKAKGCNDIKWYMKSPQLIKDVGNIVYAQALGQPSTIKVSSSEGSIDQLWTPSGIMAIDYVPGPGISDSNVSPVNICARNQYSFIRHMNSGSANYDAPDLMMYYLAMDACYQDYFFMRRIYGIASTYSQRNRYLPTALLKAMSMDPEDVYKNLAQLRSYINQLANRLSALCVPDNLDLFRRHAFMLDGIYSDSDDVGKSQLYFFKPTCSYKVNVTTEHGTALIAEPWNSDNLTVNQLWSRARDRVDLLLVNEDFNIMSGDVKKAFGNSLFSLEQIPESYAVVPVKNYEVLEQIHNAVSAGRCEWNTGNPTANGNIYQDPANGVIYYHYQGTTLSEGAFIQPRVLNTWVSAPSPEDTMINTRLQYSGASANNGVITVSSSGSEIVSGFEVFTFRVDPDSGTWTLFTRLYDSFIRMYYSSNSITMNDAWMLLMDDITKFDFHPIFYAVQVDGETGAAKYLNIIADLANYTTISDQDITRLHEVALMSLYAVPYGG